MVVQLSSHMSPFFVLRPKKPPTEFAKIHFHALAFGDFSLERRRALGDFPLQFIIRPSQSFFRHLQWSELGNERRDFRFPLGASIINPGSNAPSISHEINCSLVHLASAGRTELLHCFCIGCRIFRRR